MNEQITHAFDGTWHTRVPLQECDRLVPALLRGHEVQVGDILADRDRFESLFGRAVTHEPSLVPRATSGAVWQIDLKRSAGITFDEEMKVLFLVPVG